LNVHWGVKSEKNWTMLCGPGACSVHAPRRPSTPVLARAPAWKGALLERTCSLQLRALVRSERVSSHLGKNLGSTAAELLRRKRAHAKRTSCCCCCCCCCCCWWTKLTGPTPHHPQGRRRALTLPNYACCSPAILGCHRQSKTALREQKTAAYPLKTVRMLGERIYLRGAICIYARHQDAEGVSFEPGNGPSQSGVAPAVRKR